MRQQYFLQELKLLSFHTMWCIARLMRDEIREEKINCVGETG